MLRYVFDPVSGAYLRSQEFPDEGPYPLYSTTVSIPPDFYITPGSSPLWDGTGSWKPLPAPVTPKIRVHIEDMTVDPAMGTINMTKHEATLKKDAVPVVKLKLLSVDTGEVVPITWPFRMPIIATDGREEILIVSFNKGLADLSIPCPSSGIWKVTESIINRELEADEQMEFVGFTLFVGRS